MGGTLKKDFIYLIEKERESTRRWSGRGRQRNRETDVILGQEHSPGPGPQKPAPTTFHYLLPSEVGECGHFRSRGR